MDNIYPFIADRFFEIVQALVKKQIINVACDDKSDSYVDWLFTKIASKMEDEGLDINDYPYEVDLHPTTGPMYKNSMNKVIQLCPILPTNASAKVLLHRKGYQ